MTGPAFQHLSAVWPPPADPEGEFFADLHRYGGVRAEARDRHRGERQKFKRRQQDLAAAAVVEFGFALIIGGRAGMFLALLGLFVVQCGVAETRRMRACGRYHQCNRSMEVIGI
jgi:hypothetical protein